MNYSSFKIIIFISLLCGNIIWIGYQAKLTAELATIGEEMPFEDLEGLAQTDWTLVTFPVGFPHSAVFIEAKNSSDYQRVYHSNMKTERSFALGYASSKSINQTLRKPKTAIFAMNDDVPKSIRCRVIKCLTKIFRN